MNMTEQISWDKAFALEQLGGDEHLLCKYLKVYAESVRKDLNVLEDAIISRNWTAIWDAAHSLKGAASNIGMNGITDVSQALEDAAETQNVDASHNLFQLLKHLQVELEVIITETCSGD